MKTLKVGSFEDLMAGCDRAKIRCLVSGDVVRTLSVEHVGSELERVVTVEFSTGNSVIRIPMDTEIYYEPWDMDRGSLLFMPAGGIVPYKICTEGDIIVYPEETECGPPVQSRSLSIGPASADPVQIAVVESANLDLEDMRAEAHVGRPNFDAAAQVLGQAYDANTHALILEGLIDGDPCDDLGRALQPVVDFLRKIR